ncbi:MAG: hypothetical protein M0C28_27875 [Candidatus Moduliflexus flocculans]|nr:hypothetical protein [Candidatus Moduliflexus flocculans]
MGTEVRLRHGELLNEDGTLNRRPQRERRGHGRLRPPRRRARGLRAALHLPRFPLRRE